ncbi:MAG TPA: cytochrome c [Polyangia bacterium]|jgi:mono/diheme cytochrome c family protein
MKGKSQTRLHTLAVLQALALCAGLTAVAGCDENVLDPMADRQPRSTRYKESRFYADGLSMRAAPEGTVPRERITLNPRLTTGRDPDGPMQMNAEPLPNYVATIPIPVSRKLLELGRKRFDITCATCHGPLADGKSIVATQMALRPPPSLIDPKYIAKPAGFIFEVATKGFGLMASYAAELTVEERWAVVAYLRAVQLSQTTSVGALPPDIRQQLEALPADVGSPAPPPPPQQQHEEEKR